MSDEQGGLWPTDEEIEAWMDEAKDLDYAYSDRVFAGSVLAWERARVAPEIVGLRELVTRATREDEDMIASLRERLAACNPCCSCGADPRVVPPSGQEVPIVRGALNAQAEAEQKVFALREQVGRLANFIMHEVPGEPSRSEGTVDCAIRIIRTLRERLASAEARADDLEKQLRVEVDVHLAGAVKAMERYASRYKATASEVARLRAALKRIGNLPCEACGILMAECGRCQDISEAYAALSISNARGGEQPGGHRDERTKAHAAERSATAASNVPAHSHAVLGTTANAPGWWWLKRVTQFGQTVVEPVHVYMEPSCGLEFRAPSVRDGSLQRLGVTPAFAFPDGWEWLGRCLQPTDIEGLRRERDEARELARVFFGTMDASMRRFAMLHRDPQAWLSPGCERPTTGGAK